MLCSASCLTCTGTFSYCLSCGFSQLGSFLYLYSNQCLLNCPTHYFANVTTNTCDPCTPGCSVCYSSGFSSCTACNNDTNNAIYYKYIGSDICNTSCPNGQFISSSVLYLCQACSSICVTCSISAENCTSSNCSANYYFLNNSCLSICPDNYYPNPSIRQCSPCVAGCQTCFGGDLNSCTKCNSPNGTQYYLQIGLTQCASYCNSGEFENSTTGKCVTCNSACATCTSLIVCQSC